MNKTLKHFLWALLLVLLAVWAVRVLLHRQRLHLTEPVAIYVPTGSSFDQLMDTLQANGCITDPAVFRSMAKARNLDDHVRGGRYVLQPGMPLLKVVTKLSSGNQDPVRLTLNKFRTKQQLCDFLDARLELCGDSLLALLNDTALCDTLGFNPNTVIALFIPNTYECYWTVTPRALLTRMDKEYHRFWSASRRNKAEQMGLTPVEVMTLASIVDEETNANEEKATIASVYLNRLRRGMPLQADPTLKYAAGDFTLRRLLHRHTQIASPYNTYLHRGLPPGPICTPSIAGIDAVLQNKQTDYLFFCAKEDMSGRHNFARNADEHAANAARFHQALNQRGIK